MAKKKATVNRPPLQIRLLQLHVGDDVVAELRALDFGRAFHLAGEIVGDSLGADGAVEALEDQVGGFGPAHVTEHHFAGENDGAGIYHVLVRIFGRGAVRGLENGVAGDVIDVAAGGDADAADLRREGVAEIIAVEIERGDDVEVRRARQHLLQRDVGDGVLDDDAGAGFAFGNLAPRAAVDLHRAEILLRDLIAPVAEGALGELHDVALVDERDALALVLDGILDRAVDEAHAAGVADGLDADADLHVGREIRRADCLPKLLGGGLVPKRIFLNSFGKFLGQEIRGPSAASGVPAGVFDARVNVLGVLAEDDHVHLFGMLHGRGHAGEPLHRAQADVEVEHLAQRDVERADAAADGRGQRALDADEVFLERLDGVIRQPVVELS